jgi:hypothetical protein
MSNCLESSTKMNHHSWKSFTRMGIRAYELEMKEKKSESNMGRGGKGEGEGVVDSRVASDRRAVG